MKNATTLRGAIGHHIWIKFSGRPYRGWYRKLCKGDCQSSAVFGLERVKIYPAVFSSTDYPSTSEPLGDENGLVNQTVKHIISKLTLTSSGHYFMMKVTALGVVKSSDACRCTAQMAVEFRYAPILEPPQVFASERRRVPQSLKIYMQICRVFRVDTLKRKN